MHASLHAVAALPRRGAAAPPSRLAAPAARPRALAIKRAVRRVATASAAPADGEAAREAREARARKHHQAPEAPESVARHIEGLAQTDEADGPSVIRLVYDSQWLRPVIHVCVSSIDEDLHIPMMVLTPHDDAVDASEVEDASAFPKVATIPSGTAAFCLSGDGPDAWDNPGRRPYARYQITEPGACAVARSVSPVRA